MRRLAADHPTTTVGLVAFLALAAILLVDNRQLFDEPIHEDGDFAANAVIIQDAKQFDLLVGHYSRQGFSHPGPAAFYIEAAGEWALHDAMGVVPAPYNGQAVALLVWNAALLAAALALIYRVSRSVLAVVAAGAAILAFASTYDSIISWTWMPYYCVAPFFLLLTALAVLAAGDADGLPFVVLAGGLLVHGHVQFLFFVPLLSAAGLVAFVAGKGGWRQAVAGSRVAGGWALGIGAVFLLPIVLNLLLHWPGEFDDYIRYSTNSDAPDHTVRAGLDYVLRFWSDGPRGPLLGLVVAGAAVALVAHLAPGPLRRFGVAALSLVGLASVLLWFYALRGIDDLGFDYVGFFYWGALMLTLVVGAVAAVATVRLRSPAGGAVAVLSLVVVTLSTRGNGLDNTYPGDPKVPAVVRRLAAETADEGSPMVIGFDAYAWPDVVGVLVEAGRHGIDVCADISQQPSDVTDEFAIVFTDRFVCTADELEGGPDVEFVAPGRSTDGRTIATMPYSVVTLAP